MASIIDNRNKTMLDSLRNSLKQAESVDILTAFFYFSGFDALADDLKDKKIRILVGNTIDPDAIEDLCRAVKDSPDELLETYAVRGYNRLNNSQKKNNYIDSFVDMFNKSSLAEEFDSAESQAIFKMFLEKIKDGTLEIRLTANQNHAKAYILTNLPEYSCFGDQKGVVFTGSSNFTYNGLLGQGEMNERFSDNDKYDEYMASFESLWNDSKAIDVCIKEGNNDFEKELKKRLWIFAQPAPYQIFIRILYFLSKTYCELIFNIFTNDFVRNQDKKKMQEFCKNENIPLCSKDEMVNLITNRLKSGNIKYSFSYEFKIATNTELYQIMFFTPNIRGLEKLKEALWNTFDGKEFHRNRLETDSSQLSFFTDDDEKDWRLQSYSAIAQEMILQKYKGQTVDYLKIEEYVIENTMLNGNHLIENVLKPLISSGKITKLGLVKRSSNFKKDQYQIGGSL